MQMSAANVSVLLLATLLQLALATSSSSSLSEDLKNGTQLTVAADGADKKFQRGRTGRMLDLDVLAGDIDKNEKAAKSLTGNRQSRTLTSGLASSVEGRSPSGKKGGKKMAIKGFIPIVSLEGGKHFDPSQLDSSDSDDSEDNNSDSSEPQQQSNNLREHLATSYGGQTSIGHASFAPTAQQQQQHSGEQQQWLQLLAAQQQQYGQTDQTQSEAARSTRKLLGSSNILSGLTGGSKRGGLVSSLVPSSGYGSAYPIVAASQHQLVSSPMNLPPVQQPITSSLVDGNECICVPFFQCKNGFLSESQLSKSQLAQMSRLLQKAPMSSHQIPRSLSNFKIATQQSNDLYYTPQPQASIQTQLNDQQQQQQQLPQQQQQEQQQYVNDLIYDQLRKSIEGADLEQQLQQQEAYNSANQQNLALVDERQAPTASNSTLAEGEERGLLDSLQNRRQFQQPARSCGLMRTCCRLPPRLTRATYSMPPSHSISPARLGALTPHPLTGPTSIGRPLQPTAHTNHYQFVQPMRQQQQQPNHANSYNYQHAQPLAGSNPALDSYPPTVPLPLASQTRPSLAVQQPAGSFMMGRCGMRQTLGISGRVQNQGEGGQQHLAEGETTAEFGEFPAHAAILKRLSPGDSLFVCSAVLISGQWLATAAHCVRKSRPDELKVRLGEWDVNRDDEFYPFFESNVREIVVHPDFQPASLINDIALLRIEQPVDQQQMPHIAPACLATPLDLSGLDGHSAAAGQRCWLAGWGKDAFGQAGAFQSVLKKVDLPVVSHGECESALRYQTKLGKYFRLHASNICAGGERGKDACEGDGGAGLYCLDQATGLSKAVGLVSWGVGCGQRGVPGVYVSLAHFSQWVESVVVSSGEENVYLDGRGGQLDAQAFKNIISERSNHNLTVGAVDTTPAPTTTGAGPQVIEEARSANGTQTTR